jgi:hypothetical protein
MKKTFLSWLLISSSLMVFAQIDTTRRTMDTTKRDTTNMYNTNVNRNTDSMGVTNYNNPDTSTSVSAYPAYGTTSVTIPYRAQVNLSRDYPMVSSSSVNWTRQGEWYHGTYMNNGRYSHIYYDDRGNTWTVAMPVTQTYVPDDILGKATTMFGPMIYDVTTLKGDSAHTTIYQIRTIENGQVKAQWIGEDGSSIMDPFRVDVVTDVNTSTNAAMNNGNADTSANMNHADTSMNRNNMDSTDMNNHNMDSTYMNSQNMDSTHHDMNMDMNKKTDSTMNNAEGTKVKIKTETSDGKETKTKIKEGKVKKDD